MKGCKIYIIDFVMVLIGFWELNRRYGNSNVSLGLFGCG